MIDNPIIQFTEISKSFFRTKILTDVTVTIHGGRVYLLSGENGAGKTTLLKILSGLLTPDQGSVDFGFHSRSIKQSRKELLRYLMYMHQTPYMFEGSVSRNLSIALKPFMISRHRDRNINDALAMGHAVEAQIGAGKIPFRWPTAKGGACPRLASAISVLVIGRTGDQYGRPFRVTNA